jgi:hypothetical protein
MEMHAIQSKQASMSSGCIVANPSVIFQLFPHRRLSLAHNMSGVFSK